MERGEERKEPIVISLGGSLVVPDGIDALFLKQFKSVIDEYVEKEGRFVIVVGGGRTTRRYQEAARSVRPLTDEDADWLGIHGTRLNAHLLRTIFIDSAHPKIFSSPNDDMRFDEPIAVGAGWRPGFSTDYVAASIAEQIGAHRVVNLSNIDYAYDKDPRAYRDAKPIARIFWPEYRKLIPPAWTPGLNVPFDPIASKKAEGLGLEVAIMNGHNLENFKYYLDGKECIGTVIS